jgi:hypothetical protein
MKAAFLAETIRDLNEFQHRTVLVRALAKAVPRAVVVGREMVVDRKRRVLSDDVLDGVPSVGLVPVVKMPVRCGGVMLNRAAVDRLPLLLWQ